MIVLLLFVRGFCQGTMHVVPHVLYRSRTCNGLATCIIEILKRDPELSQEKYSVWGRRTKSGPEMHSSVLEMNALSHQHGDFLGDFMSMLANQIRAEVFAVMGLLTF